MYSPELEAEERKNMAISGIITASTTVLLLLFSLIWTAYRQRIPPPGFKEYEVVGAIDFGNNTNGSRKVNNFLPPVEKPAETPPPSAASKPTPTPAVKPTQVPPVVTTPAPSPVTVPSTTPKPTPTPPKPTPTPPKPTPTPPSTPSTNAPSTNPSTPSTQPVKPSTQTGTPGSNQGTNTSGTGNAGTPDIRVLDPNGLYSFGEGVGGANGRKPISIPQPKYNSQQEGKVKFVFKVAPDGTVISVTAITDKNELKQAGLDAIRSWRFNAVDPSAGVQTLNVTITFKLK